jgi:sulfite reductase (ferredoxin)
VLADSGHADLPVRLNMTGCPNGCSRPYTAEIGVVGRTKKTYDVYVGGSPGGDRLATRIRADVPFDQLAATIAPLFEHFRDGASFGDWADGVGTATIETWLPEPVVRRRQRATAEAATD